MFNNWSIFDTFGYRGQLVMATFFTILIVMYCYAKSWMNKDFKRRWKATPDG